MKKFRQRPGGQTVAENENLTADSNETLIRYSCIHRIVTTVVLIVFMIIVINVFKLDIPVFFPAVIFTAFILVNLAMIIFPMPAAGMLNTIIRMIHVLILTYAVYLFGGIHANPLTAAYVLVIVYAGIFYSRWNAAATVIMSLLAYNGLVLLQYRGIVHPPVVHFDVHPPDLNYFLMQMLVNSTLMIIGGYFAVSILETLKKRSETMNSYSSGIEDTMREQTGRLRRTETYLNRIMSSVREFAIITINARGSIKTFSEGSKGLFGWQPAELEGAHISVLHSSQDAETLTRLLDRANKVFSQDSKIDQLSETRVKLRKKNGNEFVSELSLSPLHIEDEEGGFILIIHDISSRDEIERRLKQSESRYEGFVNALRDSLFMLDPDGNFTWGNQTFLELSGYTLDDLLAGRARPDAIFVLDGDQSRKMHELASWASDMYLVHKSGRRIPVGLNISIMKEEGGSKGAIGVIKDLTSIRENEQYIATYTRQLQESRTEMEKVNAQLISQQKELIHSKHELEKLNKVKSAFLANLSQELKTPLVAGMGYVDLILNGDAGAVTPDAVNYLQISYKNLKRLGLMIDNLLTFSQFTDGTAIEEYAVIDLVQRIPAWLHEEVRDRGIHLSLQIPQPMAQVEGDEFLLSKVFVNLAYFSRSHTPMSPPAVVISAKAKANRMIELSYLHKGLELGRDTITHLFDSFMDNDRPAEVQGGGSRGIGLFVVKNIVELHGGTISVATLQGQGTLFTFALRRHMA